MSHRKKYVCAEELPFFNVNAGYVKMDAHKALSILEDALRGSSDGYLAPEHYSALCSLANIILTREKKIRALTERLDKKWKGTSP